MKRLAGLTLREDLGSPDNLRLTEAELAMLKRLMPHNSKRPLYPVGSEEWKICKSLARKGLVQRSGVFALKAGVEAYIQSQK